MTHAAHRIDSGSLRAYAELRPEALRVRIVNILACGIPRTAKELAAMLHAPLITTRSRLSDGCADPITGLTKSGHAPIFRKAVRVEEDGSSCRVWAFGLAEVPAQVPAAAGMGEA